MNGAYTCVRCVLCVSGAACEVLCVAAIVAAQQIGAYRAEQWPQFRGPGSTGVAEGTNLPDTWSTTQNVTWKTTIPGQRLVVADRVGRSDLRHVGDSRRRDRNAEARPLSPGRAPRADDRASLHGLRDRLRDRKDRLAAARCIAAFRRERGISRTRSRRRRRSPTANSCTRRSAMSASTPWTSTARWCGRNQSTPPPRAMAGARHRHRCCTTAACISSTTTKTRRR